MRYALEQGPSEKRILQTCLRENLPYPKAIANAPTLQLGLELFYTAYMDLNSCRGESGRILWTAANEWAYRYELEQELAENLFQHIHAMDDVYVEWRKKKDKENSG